MERKGIPLNNNNTDSNTNPECPPSNLLEPLSHIRNQPENEATAEYNIPSSSTHVNSTESGELMQCEEQIIKLPVYYSDQSTDERSNPQKEVRENTSQTCKQTDDHLKQGGQSQQSVKVSLPGTSTNSIATSISILGESLYVTNDSSTLQSLYFTNDSLSPAVRGRPLYLTPDLSFIQSSLSGSFGYSIATTSITETALPGISEQACVQQQLTRASETPLTSESLLDGCLKETTDVENTKTEIDSKSQSVSQLSHSTSADDTLQDTTTDPLDIFCDETFLNSPTDETVNALKRQLDCPAECQSRQQ